MAHYHRHHHHHSSHVSAPIFAHPSHVSYSRRSHPAVPTSSVSTSTSRQHTYHGSAPTRVVYPSAASIDPVLASHPHTSRAAIEFDLTLPPSHILIPHSSARSSYAGLSSHDLARPATSPPQPVLHIRCTDLPWPIDIYPASASGSTVVTVGDVLHGLYRALRHRASASEWHASSPGMQQRVRDAWLRRCKRQQSHKERTYESSNGLRRIDWLTKNTVFRGLTQGHARDHWVMHVGQGEKSVKFWTGS